MTKIKKNISIFLMAIMFLGICTSLAMAYTLMTKGYYQSSIDMKYDSSLTSAYQTGISNAIDAWNSKNISPVNFYTKLDSSNKVSQTFSLGEYAA